MDLIDLQDDALMELLPTHGFATESLQLLRNGDRVGLIRKRQDALIDGERAFMKERCVTLPTTRIASSVADSETSDEEPDE